MRITEKVKKTIRYVNGFGCVVVEQVAKANDVGYRNGARHVQAMCGAGLLKRAKLSISTLSPIICTPLGCKIAGDSLRPLRGIRVGELQHDLRLVDVARGLVRELGGEFEPARRVHQRLAELGLDHTPDGILHRPNMPPTLVELELSLKSPARLKKIITGYGTNLLIESVLYLVEDPAIGRAVKEAARDYPHIKIASIVSKVASKTEAKPGSVKRTSAGLDHAKFGRVSKKATADKSGGKS